MHASPKKAGRVLLVTRAFPPRVIGGGEVSAGLLADQLALRGWQVRVLTLGGPGTEHRGGVTVERFPDRSLWGEVRLLARAACAMPGCDLVHGYNLWLYDWLGLLARLLRTPLVVTFNNLPEHLRLDPEHLLGRLRRAVVWNLDHYICLSEFLVRRYVEAGFPRDRMTVIPNMAEPQFLDPPLPKRQGAPVRLLYVGRLHPTKGVDVLIRAVARLRDRGLEVQALLAGKGRARSELEALVRELRLESRVQFLGSIAHDRVREVYDAADVFVHPTRWDEAFARTVLEAMARALPIVASDRSNLPELVGDDRYIFRSADADQLADRLEPLLRDPALRAAQGERLRERVLQYAPEHVTARIQRLYQSLLRKPCSQELASRVESREGNP